MTLQDLPLDLLLEMAKSHVWVGCALARTVKKVGLFSLDHDTKRWFKLEQDKETFILIKSSKEPYYEKLLHSWDDNPVGINNPAGINSYGVQEWYKKGNRHRGDDLPAVIWADGTKWWWKDGKQHRDNDQPAIIFSDGTREWFKDGKRHRDNNKPVIIYSDGTHG